MINYTHKITKFNINPNSKQITSVGGTGTVSGLSLSGTVTSSGSFTLGGTLSASIDNISDEHRAFNNMGDNRSTRTDFNYTTASNYGFRYVQGSANGPAWVASQSYGMFAGHMETYYNKYYNNTTMDKKCLAYHQEHN